MYTAVVSVPIPGKDIADALDAPVFMTVAQKIPGIDVFRGHDESVRNS
jgi:hypothetical protein